MYRELQVSTDFVNNRMSVETFSETHEFRLVPHKHGYRLLSDALKPLDVLLYNYRDEMKRKGFWINLDGESVWTPTDTNWEHLPLSVVRFTDSALVLHLHLPYEEPLDWHLVSAADRYDPAENLHLGSPSVLNLEDSSLMKRRVSLYSELKEQKARMAELMAARRQEMLYLGFKQDPLDNITWNYSRWKTQIYTAPTEFKSFCDWQIYEEWKHFEQDVETLRMTDRSEVDGKIREKMLSYFKFQNYVPCVSSCECGTCKTFRERATEYYQDDIDRIELLSAGNRSGNETLFELHQSRFNRQQNKITDRFDNAMKSLFAERYEVYMYRKEVPELRVFSTDETRKHLEAQGIL